MEQTTQSTHVHLNNEILVCEIQEAGEEEVFHEVVVEVVVEERVLLLLVHNVLVN